MSRILWYIRCMAPGFLVGLLLYLLLKRPRRECLAARGLRSGRLREWGMLLFWMFAGGMAVITLSPEPNWLQTWLAYIRLGQAQEVFARFGLLGAPSLPLRYRVNLIPFSQIDSIFNLIGNIIMFVPFGFFTALLWRGYTWRRALLTGLCITVGVEIWQIFAGRFFDIDDIILNTLGVLCGCWLCRLFDRLAPSAAGRFRVAQLSR